MVFLQAANPSQMSGLALPQGLVQGVELVAAIATVALTLIVYVAARSLARAEATRDLNNMWQTFNQTMLEGDNAQRYNGYFKDGRGDLASDLRLQYLVFMLLNNLHAEYINGRRRFIGRSHFLSTMTAHCAFLGDRRDEVVALMRSNGFDPDFATFIATRPR
jgi:hypothetical protein